MKKSDLKMFRGMHIFLLIMGLVFGVISFILFSIRKTLEVLPRPDIAWIGFLICSPILVIIGLLLLSYEEEDLINETDEREVILAANSSMLAYLIQTTLLALSFFLLTFMGYLNKVSAFTILAIIIISGLAGAVYNIYLRKNN